MTEHPFVTAVIVTYQSASIIDDCLEGLVGDDRVEVIVVDSGSSDASAERAATHPGVVCIPQRENVGWSVASNLGADRSTGTAIAFVNPDTRATASQLLELASHVGGDVGEVSPRFVGDSGEPQNFYFRLPSPLTGPFLYLNSGQRLDEKMGRPFIRHHLYGERLPVDHPAHAGAACMVVDASEFRRLGGFDERMWVFFSDLDLSRRLGLEGRRLEVAWEIQVTHSGGGSVKALDLDRLQAMLQRDYVAYSRVAFGRAGRVLTWAAVWAFSGVIPAVMALVRSDHQGARECISRARSVLRR
jgi:N-acetylglucosaminyl-diphospho-decaprenol L-rhamnosyltransferase